MKNKKVIIVILIIIIAISIGLSIYSIIKPKEEINGENTINDINVYTSNTSEIFKDQDIEKLSITNMSLVNKGEMSAFKAIVTNNDSEEYILDEYHSLYVIFHKDDRNIETIVLSSATLLPKSNTRIEIVVEEDLTDISEIEFQIK